MSFTVDVDLNRAAIDVFLYTPAGPIVRNVRTLGQRVQRSAIRRAPRDTGRLASSITVTVGSAPGFVFADIGSRVPYALAQHEGAGIFGRGRRIVPVRARVLRFKPSKRGATAEERERHAAEPFIYRPSVRGYPGTPYLTDALTEVMGSAARIRRLRTRR